ncbi:uncharacterized protein LOC129946658 [Eupeodes corollae]|uniref:uncharacterized protein LOC129946658 n=1 Tax=Eupeodes corollae TaxID=290404 RepID=UPI002491AE21|nr:uncharacterized protein LOC129946658 [Eupeodes corollae]
MHAVLQRNQWMVGKVYGKILGTILSAKCMEICSIEVAQGVARISKKKYSENEKIVIAILDLNEAVSGNLSGKQFGDPSDANIQVAAGSSTSVNVTMEEADEQEVLLVMFNDDSLPQPDNNENTEPQPDNTQHFVFFYTHFLFFVSLGFIFAFKEIVAVKKHFIEFMQITFIFETSSTLFIF